MRVFSSINAAVMAGSLFNMVVGLIFVLATGAALVLSVTLYFQAGALTLGSVFLVFRYTSMLREPLERLARQMNSLLTAAGGTVRIRELLATRAARGRRLGARSFASGALSVELDGVSFAYEAEPVLRGVSCRVEPGEVLGLLGRTGRARRRSRVCCSACTIRPKA